MTTQTHHLPRTQWVAAAAIATGAMVSVALGIYGNAHQPTGLEIWTLGFPSMIAMKVWLGVLALALAVVQLTTALWLYGKLGRPAGRGVGIVHRWSGRTAIVVSLPVAYHCLWSLGFQSTTTRVLAHSLLGCVLYGAFVTKVLSLRTKGSPGWLLPVAGGLLFAAVVLVVFTSSIWYLNQNGPPWNAPVSVGY